MPMCLRTLLSLFPLHADTTWRVSIYTGQHFTGDVRTYNGSFSSPDTFVVPDFEKVSSSSMTTCMTVRLRWQRPVGGTGLGVPTKLSCKRGLRAKLCSNSAAARYCAAPSAPLPSVACPDTTPLCKMLRCYAQAAAAAGLMLTRACPLPLLPPNGPQQVKIGKNETLDDAARSLVFTTSGPDAE